MEDLVFVINESVASRISVQSPPTMWAVLIQNQPDNYTLIDTARGFAVASGGAAGGDAADLLHLTSLLESTLHLRSSLYKVIVCSSCTVVVH